MAAAPVSNRDRLLPNSATSIRVLFFTLLGVLFIQTAWALVVPPFRGLDEHDHAYKAAAVARGDWSPDHEPSAEGWGEILTVPRDLVIAAGPVCESLPYTTPENCRPGPAQVDGLVTVASSASRYNPVFYFAIGSPARSFSGSEALYAMRAMSALLCATMIGLAAVATLRWARTVWPMVTMLLACTPMMLYSTAVAAPNGLEMAGALLMWSALLGIARSEGDAVSRPLVALATVGAIPLVVVRTLGPLWLCLIALTMLLLIPRHRVRLLFRDRAVVGCLGVLFLVTATAALWSLTAATNAPTPATDQPLGSAWSVLPESWILWMLQAMAAFPARNEAAPLALYAIALPTWSVVTMIALRLGDRSERAALGTVVLMSSLIPLTVTVLTFQQMGTAWQGRYGFPYSMGFILICGFILDRARTTQQHARWSMLAAGAVMLSTQLIGQLEVLRNQVETSPLSGTEAWMQPSPILVVSLSFAGVSLLVGSVATTARNRVDSLRE